MPGIRGFEYDSITINTGDISVEITPPTEETAAITENSTTGSDTIAAGQRYVEIYNAGIVQDGDQEVNMTVNGVSYPVGYRYIFQQVFKEDENILITSPAISFDGNGSRVFFKYYG